MNRKHTVNNVYNARASAYRMPSPSFSEIPFGSYNMNEHLVMNGATGRGPAPPPPRAHAQARTPGPPLHSPVAGVYSPGAGGFENEEETSPLDLTSSSINTQQQGFYIHRSQCESDGDFIWINNPPHEIFSGDSHKLPTVS